MITNALLRSTLIESALWPETFTPADRQEFITRTRRLAAERAISRPVDLATRLSMAHRVALACPLPIPPAERQYCRAVALWLRDHRRDAVAIITAAIRDLRPIRRSGPQVRGRRAR